MILTFLILYAWFSALRRVCRDELHSAGTIVFGSRTFELPVDPVLKVGGLIASAFIALLAGASFMSEWTRFALYRFAGASTSGTNDPIFGKNLSFYFFTLPVLHFLFGWLLMIAILACAIAGLFILFTGGSQLFREGAYGSSPRPLRALSAAIAFLLVVVAMRTWLGRFDTILDDHTVFGGVTYTDDHVILGGLLVICVALILGAGIAATNVFLRPRMGRLFLSPVPAVACFLVCRSVSWYMSSFIVKPNELVREQPFIGHNIRVHTPGIQPRPGCAARVSGRRHS